MNRRFNLAPMMEWSTSDCRTFWRLLTRHAICYTEMVTTGALLHGDKQRFLAFNFCEHPIALQLGGSNPKALAECAQIAEDWGYDEVNLNCGCPSDRVQNNKIGACLMAEPNLVADCIAAMRARVKIPVTVKHRTGIDNNEDYDSLAHFVQTIAQTGCDTFIVHARKAWLKGLSPKENREIPPLEYDKVIRLKRDFPRLTIVINGGITSIEQSQTLLKDLDGVMLGREAYSNPYLLARVDQDIYGSSQPSPSRGQIMRGFMDYCEQQLTQGAKLSHLTRHILGLYQGLPGARQFRRIISENAHKPGIGIELLERALNAVNGVE
jgi:tRNA-dihydrouridine synthase A